MTAAVQAPDDVMALSPRMLSDLAEAEVGFHLIECGVGCSVRGIVCPEGYRLVDVALAAGTTCHEAEGRR